MDIVNTTIYDQNTVLGFQSFNARIIKQIAWSSYAMFALIIVSVCVGLGAAIMQQAWIFLGVLVFALVVIGRRVYILFIAPKKKFSASSFAGLEQKYIFMKNCFSVIVNEQEGKVYYDKLHRIYETPAAFYLYINPRQAYIVAKDGFESAAPERLAKLLHERAEKVKYSVVRG